MINFLYLRSFFLEIVSFYEILTLKYLNLLNYDYQGYKVGLEFKVLFEFRVGVEIGVRVRFRLKVWVRV